MTDRQDNLEEGHKKDDSLEMTSAQGTTVAVRSVISYKINKTLIFISD
jgi:hypothetical protein